MANIVLKTLTIGFFKKFYFNNWNKKDHFVLFDKINSGDYTTIIRSTQKLNFFFIARNCFKFLKTVANSDQTWQEVVIFPLVYSIT